MGQFLKCYKCGHSWYAPNWFGICSECGTGNPKETFEPIEPVQKKDSNSLTPEVVKEE